MKIFFDQGWGQISDTVFINNVNGPIIEADFTATPTNTLEISGSTFINNTGSGDGAAVSYKGPHTQILITASSFLQNAAARGAGVWIYDGINAVDLSSNSFDNNFASRQGGLDQGRGRLNRCCIYGTLSRF